MATSSDTKHPSGKAAGGGGASPVTPQRRARVRKLAREGLSQAEVSRRTGISRKTVAKICAEATPPITFDRRATAAAVAAHQWDAKAERVKMGQDVLQDAQKVRAMFFAEIERVHMSVTLGEQRYSSAPGAGELRDLATTVGILIDKHLVLARFDSDDRDLPAVERWLEAMTGRGLGS